MKPSKDVCNCLRVWKQGQCHSPSIHIFAVILDKMPLRAGTVFLVHSSYFRTCRLAEHSFSLKTTIIKIAWHYFETFLIAQGKEDYKMMPMEGHQLRPHKVLTMLSKCEKPNKREMWAMSLSKRHLRLHWKVGMQKYQHNLCYKISLTLDGQIQNRSESILKGFPLPR